ncbi:MBOAT family O-acyltransferase [Oscillatoria salina]|uniref:MBOAT family O-acyltransferase n=1 Tax=Oscillatoria salina TaxID=331517 RepID=UPI001CC97ABF|nr:MBOAT family O-acyltransferase [Oscillatoria salina]MBZ8181888.1 MBOAT family protein [Oscillatoria salina IIICB1]
MLFNSLTFVIFFLLTFVIYYLPQSRQIQVPILIIASFIFYAWANPKLLFLLLISILINAITSYQVDRTANPKPRLIWAIAGVTANLLILGLFKYGKLFTELFLNLANVSALSNQGIIPLLLQIPLPIGISFYTFQGISLVIDVLREQKAGEQKEVSVEETDFLNYLFKTSFFISFFPQLIAGPIVKAHDFYPQIKTKYFADINWEIVFRSLVIGYFLKMVIADNLKDYTYWINYPYFQGLASLTMLILLFGYSMQIFADFAGYSLIAIGLGAALGYNLPDNFHFPYIARSLSEFWRRWHISLSTWLGTYLYIPLGGNKKGKVRTYINLMIVMTLGGLWHGASWSYAVWGIYHGIGLAIERFLGFNKSAPPNAELKPNLRQFFLDSIRVLTVFSFVTFGWLLFQLPRFEHAVFFLVTMFKNTDVQLQLIYIIPTLIYALPVIIYHLPYFPTFNKYIGETMPTGKKARRGGIWQDLALGIMLVGILLNSGQSNAFIYFQF